MLIIISIFKFQFQWSIIIQRIQYWSPSMIEAMMTIAIAPACLPPVCDNMTAPTHSIATQAGSITVKSILRKSTSFLVISPCGGSHLRKRSLFVLAKCFWDQTTLMKLSIQIIMHHYTVVQYENFIKICIFPILNDR